MGSRARNLLVRQRTMLVNALRAHMAEVAPQGLRHVEELTRALAQEQGRLSDLARSTLQIVVDQLHATMTRVHEVEARLAKWHRNNSVSRLLATVPGIGLMGATVIAAAVSDPSLFRLPPGSG